MPNIEQLTAKLREIVGETYIIRDPDRIRSHSVDGKKPKVIVSPATMGEVSMIVSYANDNHLAIIPKGNGTKIEIGGIPKKLDIILLTHRLNRILDCDTDNLTLSVECGIIFEEIQAGLQKEGRGYFIPLDPPFKERATLGGIVATNSSGPRRYLYGTARDWLIGTKAVFPNGDIVSSGGKTVKNVSGYDLNKLLIGSFGTLGIICEMTFKLLPLPESESTLLATFRNLEEVDRFSYEIIHSTYLPSSIEILNKSAIKNIGYSIEISELGDYLLAIGFEGIQESIDRQLNEISEMGKRMGSVGMMVLNTQEHQSFWKAMGDLPLNLKNNHLNFFSMKSNLLVSKSLKAIKSYEEISKELEIDCAVISHLGNGIIYSFVSLDRVSRKKKGVFTQLIHRFLSEALKYEGNLVLESSPLWLKRMINVWGEIRNDFKVMNLLKTGIDPNGVLSPGRFIGGI